MVKVEFDSPPLSDREMHDLEDFHSNKDEHKIGTLQELFDELHED